MTNKKNKVIRITTIYGEVLTGICLEHDKVNIYIRTKDMDVCQIWMEDIAEIVELGNIIKQA